MRFRFLSPNPSSGLLRLAQLDLVVRHLRGGGLAVLPTETGYLLAAVATSTDAVRAAFAVKQRDPANPMHIACASLDMASRYAEVSDPAGLLLGSLTPGPLSVVVPQTELLPRILVTLNGTVGIRIPDNAATLQVVAELGVPITATSLNKSGEVDDGVDWSILDTLDWGRQESVPVVDCPGSVRYAMPSTLVRLTNGEVEVLRSGPVEVGEIDQVLAQAHRSAAR